MVWAGSHVSISKGYYEAAKAAAAQGGSAFQYFPKNPRSLIVKSFDAGDASRCAAYCREQGIASIAHSPYPTNLAASDAESSQRSTLSLLNDLEIAEACGSVGVVVHFGIYKGTDLLQGYRNIIACLDRTLAAWHGSAKLLIENQAGDHALMGMTFEELTQIRNLTRFPEKIGFCLDTCHLFASGVWRMPADMQWLERARQCGYMDALCCVHLNDSMHPAGSRRDRHEVLGRGCIGEAGLRPFLHIPEIRAVPIVLETARGEDGSHREQIHQMLYWLNEAQEGEA